MPSEITKNETKNFYRNYDFDFTVKKAKTRARRRKVLTNLSGWLIMVPSLILFAFFVWYPLGANVVMSFFTNQGANPYHTFVGVDNYTAIFNDPAFLSAFGNTFQYLGWSLLIGFIFPLIIGLLLAEVVHAKSVFRFLIYFPAILSGMAVIIMWTYIFDPNGGSMLNNILGMFGIPKSDFVEAGNLAIPLIVVTMTWRGAGSTALIYLSAIQNIDQSQYEAARLDGAGMWRRAWHITLPNIAPTLSTLFVLQCISVMQVFYEPLVMTDGGPNNASLSLLLLGWKYFQRQELGNSAATSVILFLVILTLTLAYFGVQWLFKRERKIKNAPAKN